MPADRFEWQRSQVRQALSQDPSAWVLNVGANEDPAHLKDIDPKHVINCDIEEWDSHMQRPNYVDALFDAAKERWPFEDDMAEMVVLGDIIEHLTPEDCAAVLGEARRVAKRLCVTVPREVRDEIFAQVPPESNPYMFHQTEVTESYLRGQLDGAGWKVDELHVVDYGFVPEGYFVLASRK